MSCQVEDCMVCFGTVGLTSFPKHGRNQSEQSVLYQNLIQGTLGSQPYPINYNHYRIQAIRFSGLIIFATTILLLC